MFDQNIADKAARIIQHKTRKWIARKGWDKVGKAEDLEVEKEEDYATIEVCEVPYSAWIRVFEYYITSWDELLEIAKVCKLFKKISQVNTVWHTFIQNSEPRLYKFVKKQNPQIHPGRINWLQLIRTSSLEIKENLSVLSKNLSEKKEQGNLLFRNKEFDKALEIYEQAIESSEGYRNVRDNPIYLRFCEQETKLEVLKVLGTLYLNAAQAAINQEKWLAALESIRLGKRYLEKIEKLCSDLKIDFDEGFGMLQAKLLYRYKIAIKRVDSLYRFVSYSETVVEGVQLGTIISATDHISGDIFCHSDVLIVEYERHGSVKGVIINKYIELDDRRIMLGGPCDMRSYVYLHDIPNVPGAILVRDGVYYGGNAESYLNNPNYTVKKYLGYASWFGGQLDGELRSDSWTFTNEVSKEDIFTNDLVPFNINNLY